MFVARVGEGAIETPRERFEPACQDTRRVIRPKPLPRSAKLLPVLVGGNRLSGRSTRARSARLRLGVNQSKCVHKPSVSHDRVDGSARQVLLLRPKLCEKVVVSCM